MYDNYVICYVIKQNMARKRLENRNIRKLTKIGGASYAVTIPIEIIREMGWKERQKLIVEKKGSKLVVKDWE